MNLRGPLALPALAAALALLAFGFSSFRLIQIWRAAADPNVVTIRFAHWNLEHGVREAYDQLAKEYMALHPHVRVEQLAIPVRIFPMWLRTRLIGESAPDILTLGGSGITDELLARFFVPLNDAVEEPNPYNAGTEMEGVAWRNTFIDGLTSPIVFNQRLQQVFTVGMGVPTVRAFYNLDLFKRITGHENLPQTFTELLELCEQAERFAAERGESIIPIGASNHHANALLTALASVQLQRLAMESSPRATIFTANEETLLAVARGDLSFESPPLLDAFRTMRAVGRFFNQGFMQVNREDMAFQFAQGHVLMIATGSFDLRSLREEARFRLKAGPIPIPEAGHPTYGSGVLGPFSEAAVSSGRFALTRNSRHPEVALDFMRYLTSLRSNQYFAAESSWIPVVRGAALAEEMQAFAPTLLGYPTALHFFSVQLEFPDLRRVMFDRHANLLFGRNSSIEEYLAKLQGDFLPAVKQDFERIGRGRRTNIQRSDTLTSTLGLSGEAFASNRSRLLQVQLAQELSQTWMEAEMLAIYP
jgi:raffinose/stachyose/melibiose transport system substrate-binding protein